MRPLWQISSLGFTQICTKVDSPGSMVNTDLNYKIFILNRILFYSNPTCMSLFLAHSTISFSMWWWVENLDRESRRFMETDWYTWATCFSSLMRVISLRGSVYCLIEENSSLSSISFNLSSTLNIYLDGKFTHNLIHLPCCKVGEDESRPQANCKGPAFEHQLLQQHRTSHSP